MLHLMSKVIEHLGPRVFIHIRRHFSQELVAIIVVVAERGIGLDLRQYGGLFRVRDGGEELR